MAPYSPIAEPHRRRATSPRLSSTRARRPASISGRWPSRRSPSRGTLEGPACHHHHVAVRAKRVVPAHEGELIADSTLNLIAPREPATCTSKGRTQGMYLAKHGTISRILVASMEMTASTTKGYYAAARSNLKAYSCMEVPLSLFAIGTYA